VPAASAGAGASASASLGSSNGCSVAGFEVNQATLGDLNASALACQGP
jgi:hypothetical protein